MIIYIYISKACYKTFSAREKVDCLTYEFRDKLLVTLGDCTATNTPLHVFWLAKVCDQLRFVKTHVAMCLFKTWVGAWTTSFRMHEPVKLTCLFGREDADDTLDHYLTCAPLWHTCGACLGVSPPLHVAERICIISPTVEHLHLLSLCFQGYHYTKSCYLQVTEGSPHPGRDCQTALSQAVISFSKRFT